MAGFGSAVSFASLANLGLAAYLYIAGGGFGMLAPVIGSLAVAGLVLGIFAAVHFTKALNKDNREVCTENLVKTTQFYPAIILFLTFNVYTCIYQYLEGKIMKKLLALAILSTFSLAKPCLWPSHVLELILLKIKSSIRLQRTAATAL
ncbi:hypothetical protein [Wolbachia endosymbiont of Folsomia candida]|uniref:hypothetical protein n=1 Tax=Wolbachia endosymbiont of Folsomia candida TaxID=169402 RepID=UPI001300A408|nr:hypothetical protein [Wolbachia endosymbiont of Folsomia candida]